MRFIQRLNSNLIYGMAFSAVIVAFCVVGCGKSDDDGGKDQATKDSADGKDGKAKDSAGAKTDTLGPAKIGDFAVQKFGDIYLAGQPDAATIEQAKKDGVLHVVSLRGPAEDPGFDEAKVVTDLGMRFHNPGFSSAEELTDPVFMRIRDLLDSKANRPMLLHCASGNRVGAVWLVHRVIDDKIDYDTALAEAKQIGLRSKALEDAAKAYIDSKPWEDE